MKNLSSLPFFLFLLPLFFFLRGYTDHGYFLHLSKLALPYLIIVFSMALAYGMLLVMQKDRQWAALLTFYCTTLYLFFGDIKSRFDYIPYLHSYLIFIPVLVIIPWLAGRLFKRKSALQQNIYTYCNLLMILLCVTQTLLIVINRNKADKYTLSKIHLQDQASQSGPSIHLIVWDGYPGVNSLSSHFHYDNHAIAEYFRSKHFFVADDMHSNYYQTYVSINSLLNMQYIAWLRQVPLNQYYTVLHHLKQIRESELLQFFSRHGFHLYNNSIFDLGDEAPMGATQGLMGTETKFKRSEQIHFNQVFHERILKDFLWKFIKGKFRFDYAYNKIVLQQHLYNIRTIDNLMKTRFVKPHFSYAHLMMPHDPYFTDSTGVLIDRDVASVSDPEKLFVSYLQYTNKQMQTITDHLLSTEPDAIIIIMSDHGYREYTTEAENPKKFNNLLAVYFPDSNYQTIKNIRSNVNIFRVVLNQYFRQQLPLLPDSCMSIDEAKNEFSAAALP